jgi:thiol-disulfide isomerase/thioredoxin
MAASRGVVNRVGVHRRRSIMKSIVVAAVLVGLASAMARAQDGRQPPEINAKNWLNTEPLNLAKLQGKVVVVEFWATWCGPCRASIPHLVELRKKIDRSKLEIIGLTDEPLEKVEGFAKDMKMNYSVGTGSTSGEAYGVTGIPHAFVIAPDGKIAWEGHPLDPAFESTVTKLAGTVKDKKS